MIQREGGGKIRNISEKNSSAELQNCHRNHSCPLASLQSLTGKLRSCRQEGADPWRGGLQNQVACCKRNPGCVLNLPRIKTEVVLTRL